MGSTHRRRFVTKRPRGLLVLESIETKKRVDSSSVINRFGGNAACAYAYAESVGTRDNDRCAGGAVFKLAY